jgi:hypothetical protein
MPVFVESKYEIGRRSTWACTRFRISVMARCAATLTTCERENDVDGLMSVATPAAMASGMSNSTRRFCSTSSMRNLADAGRTSPASRLIS